VVIRDSAQASHGIELTRSGESNSLPSLTVPEDLLPHVTFALQSARWWKDTDLVDNKIAEDETEPSYVTCLKEELLQTRVMDNDNAVGALGFLRSTP
jgi:hypothetical protein